jgi:sugar phosphate isomerase/epimerase
MAEVDLVGLYWTTAGPVEVHVGREWSYFDWKDRCANAQRVGMSGLGIWHADLQHQLESTSLDDIKSVFEDAGLRHLELEFLWEWFLEPDDDRRKEAEPIKELLFAAAGTLGAHHIKVGNIPGTPCDLDTLTEKYAELCAEAADHTDAKILYEFMPFDVNVNTLDAALQVVEGAGASNGGLVIDTWHMSKLDIAPDDLRRIPLEYLSWIELSDGQFEDMEDAIAEVTRFRALPGEGEFDIPGYVAVAQDMGYPGPWGVEVLSDELRSHPIEEIFDRSYETTMSQIAKASAAA